VLDLVRAVDLLRARCSIPFGVKIVGKFDDNDDYYASINDAVANHGLAPLVEILGRTESDDDLVTLYHDAHILAIPSYHEGFCRPVIEGLRAGCVPVGYSAYNLPLVANGLGRLVFPGNIGALADSLATMVEAIARTFADPSTASLPLDGGPLTLGEFEAAAAPHVNQFSFEKHDHARGQGLAGFVGLSKGEGSWLSPRAVDDPASRPPRSRARPRRDMRALPIWCRARCAKSSTRTKSNVSGLPTAPL
jgi:glycosyltransferase involved in cell wall biosynthesis